MQFLKLTQCRIGWSSDPEVPVEDLTSPELFINPNMIASVCRYYSHYEYQEGHHPPTEIVMSTTRVHWSAGGHHPPMRESLRYLVREGHDQIIAMIDPTVIEAPRLDEPPGD